ncbi:MAG TPA: arginine deiminase family protein [Gemmataceae bacterium]|jgi:dimethylargininase|nr:arginine deiminase family protein [Gemmataceae bacterium]
MIALTHVPSPNMSAGLRTFVGRVPIDADLAMRQHVEFRRMLGRCGALVRTIDGNRNLPDCAFVEDAAVVLDEVAVLTSMGAADRRLELPVIERELAKYRKLERIEYPASLDGGDVLAVGRTLFVGLSSRTNFAGIEALEAIVRKYGYRVIPVPVGGSLHLKTACTALDDGTLLVNPNWIDTKPLKEFELIPVPEEEPWAANVLRVGGRICMAEGNPRTTDLIRNRGLQVETVDLSEFAKAEAGITCLSILFEA